jgi:hypothetical protein
MSYCPLFCGSGVIYTKYDIPYILEQDDKKLIFYAFYGLFRELLPTVLGPGVIYKAHDT